MTTQVTVPPWFSSLPQLPGGMRALCVDNDALSAYFFEASSDPELRAIFESPVIRLQCSRQVIDEALNSPGLAPSARPAIWAALADYQARGRLFLSGTTQMTPAVLAVYNELRGLFSASNLSATDAAVLADAIVKGIPLYTRERRARTGFFNALRNHKVKEFLTGHGLPTQADDVLVGTPTYS